MRKWKRLISPCQQFLILNSKSILKQSAKSKKKEWNFLKFECQNKMSTDEYHRYL